MYKIRNLIVPVTSQADLYQLLSHKLHLPVSAIEEVEILRISLDARQKNHLKFNLTLKADISINIKLNNDVQIYQEPQPYIDFSYQVSNDHPFIIGAGPAGLFAALALVEKGFQPYIFERGDCLEKRSRKVAEFWKNGILDEESNVQFGEGGAGTFSDGKLTSRKNDYYTRKVTEYLIKFGADKKIAYEALPHLGTDGIRMIIKKLRTYLESKGCKFFWNHKLEDIALVNGKISTLKINQEIYRPEIVVLAIGNSARDTFHLLSQKIAMQAKPFAVGFRIEHPQDFINKAFYGRKTDFSITGPAVYRLTAQIEKRGVYSFCMCPGGQIIAACSENNSVVTNGMSSSSRKGKFANSAIVVTVNEKDFGNGILAGMEYQRKIEQLCYNHHLPYFAPAQNAADFMQSIVSNQIRNSSYLPGIYSFDLNSIYSDQITAAIKAGMKVFEKRTKGFIENGIFAAPETRTSSPVRILRNDSTYNSRSASNLFPCGEGSGYAGGIMSSAADGYKIGSILSKS